MLDELSGRGEDAELFANSIVCHLTQRFGWSITYYGKADAAHYWLMTQDYEGNYDGYDLVDKKPEPSDPAELVRLREEFETFWEGTDESLGWRWDKSWTDAYWLSEYTGDTITELMNYHIQDRERRALAGLTDVELQKELALARAALDPDDRKTVGWLDALSKEADRRKGDSK